MKIFLQGDFKMNTGPAIANRSLKESLEKVGNIKISHSENVIGRVIELFIKTLWSENIILCSFSKSDLITIFLAKCFHRPIFYYMHGCNKIEFEINQNLDPKGLLMEKKILEKVNKIICLSELQKKKVSKEYPEHADKIVVHYNSFNLKSINFAERNKDKGKVVIFSTGGGMPRKANLVVCEAIKRLNEKKNEIEYIVAGKSYGYKAEFEKYPFVTYYDELSHEKVLDIMKRCDVYVQNSRFETFGLSVLEGLFHGASILVGKNIGALEVLPNIQNVDIIENNDDAAEISEKLRVLLQQGNAGRLYYNTNFDCVDNLKSGKNLIDKLFIKKG